VRQHPEPGVKPSHDNDRPFMAVPPPHARSGYIRDKSLMNSKGLDPVNPVRPAAPWVGGKRLLSKRICKIIENTPHTMYAEPFVGMGGVFLRRSLRPKAEAINDVNQELITLFRILQRHYVEFTDMIKWRLSSRADFQRLNKQDPATLTDLERAARFLYLQRLAFGGRVGSNSFGVATDYPGRFDTTKLLPMLEELHDRLSGVVIECLPYQDFIRRYDRAGTFFYLDPPYWGCEDDYGKNIFSADDFEILAGTLKDLKGVFLLSINDVLEIRQAFDGFALCEVQTTYSVGKGNGKKAAELLISNRPGLLSLQE